MTSDAEELWKTWFSGLARRQNGFTAGIGIGSVPSGGHNEARKERAFDGELVAREAPKMANQNETTQENPVEDLWRTWYSGLQKKHTDFAAKMKTAVDGRNGSRRRAVSNAGPAAKEAGKR